MVILDVPAEPEVETLEWLSPLPEPVPASGILVHVEVDGPVFAKSSLEVLSGARGIADSLGVSVVAAVLGQNLIDRAASLGQFGAHKVLVADDPVFVRCGADAQADVLGQIAERLHPRAILLSASLDGRDIAGRLAVRLGAGLLANASTLRLVDGKLVSDEVAFEGRLVVSCTTIGNGTQVVTIRPRAFNALEAWGEAVVERLDLQPSPASVRVRTIEVVRQAQADAVPLDAADIVLSGGRGLGGPEAFVELQQLAAALGGAVGASRAAVDAGWVPYAMQVGQTGKQIKPKAYLAFGISGAIQHKVGMQNSAAIVAVNKDREAPIFEFADLGIVGNALSILPRLMEAVRNRK